MKQDIAWCQEHGKEFLPVVFPGFSWHNMKGGPSNQIPRERGKFLWSQFCNDKQVNASMVYVAMFDEVDEGTAIFKASNHPPATEETPFVTYDDLPSDYYLRLVGQGAKMLRGEAPVDSGKPEK